MIEYEFDILPEFHVATNAPRHSDEINHSFLWEEYALLSLSTECWLYFDLLLILPDKIHKNESEDEDNVDNVNNDVYDYYGNDDDD